MESKKPAELAPNDFDSVQFYFQEIKNNAVESTQNAG